MVKKHPDADPLPVEKDKFAQEIDDPGISPSRISSHRVRREAERALAWVLVIGGIALAVYIARPLLVIFGAMVFAALIDGGTRLLGKVLPIPRGLRVALVCLFTVAFVAWLVIFAGERISEEASQFPALIEAQVAEVLNWLQAQGFDISQAQVQDYTNQIASGVGILTTMLGGALGFAATVLVIVIIGIYVAAEPRLYERGVAWLFPRESRDGLYVTLDRMAFTMRRYMAGRLLGMLVEGVFTYILLAWYGVPLASLLAIITGLLAFVPNIGAIISGIFMVTVGFSGGWEMGLYTIFVYLLVQNFDGYVVIPLIARKTVDLAPALVLGFQLIMGLLFGILGLFLADPLMAMIKVMLERRAEQNAMEEGLDPDDVKTSPGDAARS